MTAEAGTELPTQTFTVTRADLRGSNLAGLDPRAVDLTGAVVHAEQAFQLVQTLGLEVR